MLPSLENNCFQKPSSDKKFRGLCLNFFGTFSFLLDSLPLLDSLCVWDLCFRSHARLKDYFF